MSRGINGGIIGKNNDTGGGVLSVNEKFLLLSGQVIAAGGDVITEGGGYRVHKFTSSGTFQVLSSSVDVEILLVAGGGGGGLHSGGGGGAGGLLYYGSETPKTPNGPAVTLAAGTYSIYVGAAGAASVGPYNVPGVSANGKNGTSSKFVLSNGTTQYEALGGGGGGSGGNDIAGSSGGSGGGGGRSIAAGTGTSGQGHDGGFPNTGQTANYPGGGGGGAGAAGGNGSTSQGGDGGVGLQYSISGTATYYAGGGGGVLQAGSDGSPPQGAGGLGGGGNARAMPTVGDDGAPNTGGGGGAADYSSLGGGSGGSGIVIIRYQI